MARIDTRIREELKRLSSMAIVKENRQKMCDGCVSLTNKRVSEFSIYIDAVSSIRSDRINGKKYMAAHVKGIDKKGVYILVIPDESAFDKYQDPTRERELAIKLIDSVPTAQDCEIDVVVRESKLPKLLSELNSYKGNDVHKRRTFQRIVRETV